VKLSHTPLNPASRYVLVETLRPFVGAPAVAVLDEYREDGTRVAGPTVTWAEWVRQAVSQGTASQSWRRTCYGAEQAPSSTRESSWKAGELLGACRHCTVELRVRKDGRVPRHGCDLVTWEGSGRVEPLLASRPWGDV
jgi:hypothetical protein